MDRTDTGDFLSLTEAAARSGTSRQTLSGRVRLGLLPAFSDPRDRRFVLLRASDVDSLSVPRPRAARPEGATAGTA